jgi:hypothetical protein
VYGEQNMQKQRFGGNAAAHPTMVNPPLTLNT